MKMKTPDGVTSVSTDGAEYPVVDGYVVIPTQTPAMMEQLKAHGLVEAVDEVKLVSSDDPDEPVKTVSGADDKSALAQDAVDKFGVVLDRRKSLATLQKEFKILEEAAKKLDQEAAEKAAAEAAAQDQTASDKPAE